MLNDHDDSCIPWGGEPILRDGQNVGVTSSAAIEYLQNSPVCMGYVTNDVERLETGRYQVNVAGQLYPSKISIATIQRSAAFNQMCL